MRPIHYVFASGDDTSAYPCAETLFETFKTEETRCDFVIVLDTSGSMKSDFHAQLYAKKPGSRKAAPETEIVFQSNHSETGDLSLAKTNRQRFKIVRVIDGDTVKLSTGETLRYIGIDTPETKHPSKEVEYFGKEASVFNHQLGSGRDILVEFDLTKRDKYGRLLGYIFLPDGTFVNAELVKKGLPSNAVKG